MQAPTRKLSPSNSQKDLWLVVREGSLADVDSALALLKKNGGNINSRNAMGLTALHIATWRNHIPIVRRLLAAGADPDARVCYFAYPLAHLNTFRQKQVYFEVGFVFLIFLNFFSSNNTF